MSDVLERPDTVPMKPPAASKSTVPVAPPAPRAPAVLEQRPALECELANLRLQVAEKALAAYEDRGAGRDKLAALDAAIHACAFQIECNTLAHDLALRIDREAVAAWRSQVQADPERAVEGITKEKCCRRCTSDTAGCIISGDVCMHPIKAGNGSLPARLQGNPVVRAVHQAAAEKLGVYR
jgi:hypothetical protein